jgi:hypothetical protein
MTYDSAVDPIFSKLKVRLMHLIELFSALLKNNNLVLVQKFFSCKFVILKLKEECLKILRISLRNRSSC